jgi:O-methyltransferase
MIKKIIKNLYKRNSLVKCGVDYFQPRLQEFYLKLKDVVMVRWSKLKLIGEVRPFTMLSYPRLSKLFELISELNRRGISGDVVECGVYNGGSAGVLSAIAQNRKRNIWLFDSFEGLPEPTIEDGELAASYVGGRPRGELRAIGQCVGSESKTRELLFNRLGVDSQRVHIIKGWFQNTLPDFKKKVGAIALLHLDGDWYESTKVCLENLYPKVIRGGYIVLDDYGCWEGCRKAVDEYFKKNGIKAKLINVDDTGVYFKKP